MNIVSRQRIVVASANKNKILELQTVAKDFAVELLSPAQAAAEMKLPDPPDVTEDGQTYFENARKKAAAFARWARMPALGDDSGLEVSALGNRPGIQSARYAGAGASDEQKIDKLLNELGANPQRAACFRCILVLAYPSGELVSSEGELKGQILHQRQGTNGFGYDPIVLIDELGLTLAEVDFSVTCTHGFRAKAAQRLFSSLCSG